MKATSSSSSLSSESIANIPLKSDLPDPWCLWVQDLNMKEKKNEANYHQQVKKLVTIKTMGDFCKFFAALRKPKDIPSGADVYFFKQGIKPLWEDPKNNSGGRFFLHIKKTFATKLWESLLFSVVSREIPQTRFVNGIILKIHRLEVVFYIWTEELDLENQEILKQWVKETVGLSRKIRLEFKFHPTKHNKKLGRAKKK